MRLGDKLRRKIFTTIVEVFPPTFSADPSTEPLLGLREKTADLVERVKRVESLADAILVADVNDLSRLKLSSVYTAAVLHRELGVEAIPVITARDMNKAAIKTMILTALSYGIDSVMCVWGDRYQDGAAAKNVYDYPGLSRTLSDARLLSERADCNVTLLAPVDISKLESGKGLSTARSRLENGADFLLAQPPTSDVAQTFNSHLSVLTKHALSSSVLMNVFPFRNRADIEACRSRFSWALPKELDRLAEEGGEARLLREARLVVEKVRENGLPGVYVSTRGRPELARFILA